MAEEFDITGVAEALMGMLENDEGKHQIQNIISMLGGEEPSGKKGSATGGINPENLEMMFKLQSVMSELGRAENSSQAELLKALRCFLKPERRTRLDSAVKLLNVGRAIEVIKKLEGV